MFRSLAILTITALAVAACGGGGGGGSASEGGIGGTGVTRGVITELGSATVARTTYDTDTAEVVIDGVAAAPAALRLGMNVTIVGDRDAADPSMGVANRVEFDDDLEGRIEAVVDVDFEIGGGAAITSELTIFDRTVVIRRDDTVFDGTDFDTVAAGDFVEVSGFVDDEGVIVASRIEAKAGPEVELRGELGDLVENGVDSSFEIGDVLVRFDDTGGTTLPQSPDGPIEDGFFVEVMGVFEDALIVDARTGSVEIEDQAFDGDVEDFEIEGFVSDFVDLASFRVGGQPVDASALGVEFTPGLEVVRDGALLEVEGRLDDGVLLADTVELRQSDARVSARIGDEADVDVPAGSFELLGAIQVEVDAGTRFECDDFDPDVDDLAGLAAAVAAEPIVFVEVRGVELDGVVRATRLKCRTEVDDVQVRGRVGSMVNSGIGSVPRVGQVPILGLVIDVDEATSFENVPDNPALPEPIDDFFDFLADNVLTPPLLEVEDEDDGDATDLDVADEVEVEDD